MKGSYIRAALALGCVTMSAQTTTGSISGSVSDSSGAVIPGAAVRLTNVATQVASTAFLR